MGSPSWGLAQGASDLQSWERGIQPSSSAPVAPSAAGSSAAAALCQPARQLHWSWPACPSLPPRVFAAEPAQCRQGVFKSRDRRRAQPPVTVSTGRWWPQRLCPVSLASDCLLCLSVLVREGSESARCTPLGPAAFSRPTTAHAAACTVPSVFQSPPLLFSH